MKINRNMSAVITNNQLLRTESKLSESMRRLSSGLKINKPGDNPSGMAISNKMKAQIKALEQADNNTTDGISVMQIADGALNETTSILQRIRELSVQAANGTNSQSDKQSIQDEIDQLVDEVDRISDDTEYNTKVLLDGSSDICVFATPKQASRINISDDVPMGNYDITVTKNGEQAKTEFDFASLRTAIASADEDGSYVYINDVSVRVSADMDDNTMLEALRSGAEEAGCSCEYENGTLSISSRFYGSTREIELSFSKELGQAVSNAGTYSELKWEADDDLTDGSDDGKWVALFSGSDAEITLGSPAFNATASYRADGNRIYISDKGGFSMEFLLDSDADLNSKLNLEVSDVGKMVIQTGGNEYQTIDVRIPEVSKESLYLDTVDVTVYEGADDALNTLDDALAYVTEVRARIGAYQNRLEYCDSSLDATDENMTSAYSTLMDTDMATEMTEYTQQNVLQQAATAVLSQANELPQQVLSLLQ